jgi:aerobic carbon-monoxide dehydrogenase medium subunit
MILPPFRYLRPRSLDDAVSLLAGNEGAAVLAGGQTLLNVLKLDLAAPSALVDIHRLDELRTVGLDGDGMLRIGAAVTYAALAADPIVIEHQPAISTMAAGLVDRQVRNRGTIGGNCCLNDPTSNFPPLLVALDARFHVVGPTGRRSVTADDFFAGTLITALAPDEILAAIEVPPLPETARVVHQHLQVGADSWAVARSVVRLDVAGGSVRVARVVAGAVLNAPLRMAAVEAVLVGSAAEPGLADRAAAAFDDAGVMTVDDVHCSAGYRARMSRIQLRRAVAAAVEGSGS